ncbi:MAG: DNA-3-methyladenine glycosylase I [Clostridia bacterium]|nr:DNA-3-methyladenine glycosylase I [Clostridia bacterium]
MTALIVARSKNNVIGKNGRIPWRIKGELKQFRELTTGRVVVMGRRSYEEIGHPLPNRINVVVSNTKKYSGDDLYTVGSLREALELFPAEDIFIGGGSRLFEEALSIVDVMYITEVDTVVDDGDVFFPEFDADAFNMTVGETAGEEIRYTRTVYTRKNLSRCAWCNLSNPLYVDYHDNEWCVPNFDERYLYEMLILESFQAGLSWECVLNKREAFRRAYDDFDIDKVVTYGESKTEQLMSDKSIIRNRRKIEASIKNSRIFKDIAQEFGSFGTYLQTFTKGETVYETGRTTSSLSDAISIDLRRRGMSFVGSTIIYSYLQAIGVIYSHDETCFKHRDGK